MASDSASPIGTPEAHSQSPPPATTTLCLYKRLPKGRKALFAPSDSAPASYFVSNPVPHRYHSQWRPVFYRGDNPKYTPSATVIGRAFRNALWGKIEFQLGEGVGEELENERRRKAGKKLKTKNKFRRAFGASAKDATEDLEEKPVLGRKMVIHVRRSSVFKRCVEWELNGVVYRWTGTRMFSTGFMKGAKGWSHSLKLVRVSDHALIATFEKSRWSSFSSSIKSGGPPNKSKQFVGTLRVHVPTHSEFPTAKGDATVPEIFNDHDLGIAADTDLTDAIVLTNWIVAEAEHRLRLKVLDVLQDIAEKAGEGGG